MPWVVGVSAGVLFGFACGVAVCRSKHPAGSSRCCRRSSENVVSPLLLRMDTDPTVVPLLRNATKAIFQSLTHAVVAVRANGMVLEANDAALQLLGYSAVGALCLARVMWLASHLTDSVTVARRRAA